MYAKYRRMAGIIVLILSAVAVVITPGEARMFTVLGLMILIMFLLGMEKLVRAILGLDK